jgi:transcriptional antiterminator RfaH
MYQLCPMTALIQTTPFDNNDLLWYCIKARPKQEAMTARSLRSEVQIEVFSPAIRFQRSRGQSKMWVTEALFPGYLFARFRYSDSLRHVRATRGVSQVVGFGGVPSVLPASVIVELKAFVSETEVITVKPEIHAGDEVNLVSGVFSGLRAIVTRVIPARQRVAILLELLGEVREVEVGQDDVLLDNCHPLSTQA